MKRTLTLISALLMASLSLSAEVYRSNALAQSLEEIGTLTNAGWEKETDQSGYRLYRDGTLLKERRMLPDGYETIEGNRTERVTYDSEGRIATRAIDSDGTHEEYTYFYDESGNLTSYNYSRDGAIERRVEYLTSQRGSLIALLGDLDSRLSLDFYVYDEGGRGVRLEMGESGVFERYDEDAPEKRVEVRDDGSWSEETVSDGLRVLRVYDPNGRLISEESGESEISYEYDREGSLIRKSTVDGESETVEEWGDGYSRTLYYNGVIQSVRTLLQDGTYNEVRYADGKEEFLFHYDADGSRILEITRL